MKQQLLDTSVVMQLERLRFAQRWLVTEPTGGEHSSRHHGASVEFADFREYQPGDDMRSIDWQLLARLDRWYVRLYHSEESLRIEINIDASTSMHFGQPTKASMASQLAAALGYIALRRGHTLKTTFFGQQPDLTLPPLKGRAALTNLLDFLAQNPDTGVTNINTSLQVLASQKEVGITILISDLLDPAGYALGLDTLLQSGRRVALIHLLSPEELYPEMAGTFEWIDAETAQTVEITVDRDSLILYQKTVNQWLKEIRSYCESRQILYFLVPSDASIRTVIMEQLRNGGLLT